MHALATKMNFDLSRVFEHARRGRWRAAVDALCEQVNFDAMPATRRRAREYARAWICAVAAATRTCNLDMFVDVITRLLLHLPKRWVFNAPAALEEHTLTMLRGNRHLFSICEKRNYFYIGNGLSGRVTRCERGNRTLLDVSSDGTRAILLCSDLRAQVFPFKSNNTLSCEALFTIALPETCATLYFNRNDDVIVCRDTLRNVKCCWNACNGERVTVADTSVCQRINGTSSFCVRNTDYSREITSSFDSVKVVASAKRIGRIARDEIAYTGYRVTVEACRGRTQIDYAIELE